MCVLFVYSVFVCVVYVRKKSLLVWCVAPYSDLPTATAAPCQGRPLLPGHEAFFWDLSAAYMHNATSISPWRGRGAKTKSGGGIKQWKLPLTKCRNTITGTLSTGQRPKIMCVWLNTTWQLTEDGMILSLGGRLEAENNGDKCQSQNREVQLKTLPEAQRTQGIEFITWVNFSARKVQNCFQQHYLNWLQIWSPDGATCISSKFGHQMAPHAQVPNLVTSHQSIPWVRCASGNVFNIFPTFSTFSQHFLNFCSNFFFN